MRQAEAMSGHVAGIFRQRSNPSALLLRASLVAEAGIPTGVCGGCAEALIATAIDAAEVWTLAMT